MTEYTNESLGDYLRKQREARHVSLENVSRATHLSRELIQALEEDRFESFSQPEYITGYLKLYSGYLGLDQAEILGRTEQVFAIFNERQNNAVLLTYRNNNSYPSIPARKKCVGPMLGSDRMVKRALLTVFTLSMISLFFFIPSGYKGPEEIHSALPKRTSDAGVNSSARNLSSAMVSPVNASPMNLTAPVATANSVSALQKTEPAIQVVGNEDSKRYHLPGMKYYDQVEAHHRVIFNSEQEALAAGYHRAPQ
ncbi:MAG: helix-turn-helix domain-containing protein [Syntrophales bacterium]|nr:helix-turn-helix domain-containing protein [Syntrophales bacterium]